MAALVRSARLARPLACLVAAAAVAASLMIFESPARAADPPTIALAGGVMSFTAGSGDEDVITVVANGGTGNLEFQDTGTAAVVDGDGAGGCDVAGNTATCPAADVDSIAIDAGNAKDVVMIDASVSKPATIDGGPAADVLSGGSGPDLLLEGSGLGDDVLAGNAGDDLLIADHSRDTLSGGAGDDVLQAGRGKDTLDGGSGDDMLYGGSGTDVLAGGEGGDLLQGGEDTDTYDPGPGIDWVDYSDHDKPVTVSLGPGLGVENDGQNNEKETANDFEAIRGGSADDTLIGSLDSDIFDGGPGADVIRGDDTAGTGFVNDVDTVTYADRTTPVSVSFGGGPVSGAPGEGDDIGDEVEVVVGGSANDTLGGGIVGHVFEGGPGDDTLLGGSGPDILRGGDGSDTASYASRTAPVNATLNQLADDGEQGEGDAIEADVENLTGGSAADTLRGDGQQNLLQGGDGDDQIFGGDANDTLLGGPGSDSLEGQQGDDSLSGEAGADKLDGGEGNDALLGGSGEDVLDGRGGADSLIGESDRDTADYSARTQSVGISTDDLANDGLAGEADNVASDVEVLLGGKDADVLKGGPSAQTLDGGEGDDSLQGGGGPDSLIGGAGSDSADYSARTQAVTVAPGVPSGSGEAGEGDTVSPDTENAIGGSGADLLFATPGGSILQGNQGNDTLIGGAGFDSLIGGPGADSLQGAGGSDDLRGGDGDDVLAGGDANDALHGDQGMDTLDGGSGSDSLFGGPDTDVASYASRSADLSLSLDGNSNDGQAGEADNIGGDVEGVAAGSGNDQIDSRDGQAGPIDCGPGSDTLQADAQDQATSCESVKVAAASVAGFELATSRARMSRKGRVKLKIMCTGVVPGPCAGRVTVDAKVARKKKRGRSSRKLTFATKSFSARIGEQKTVRVKLRRAARRAVLRDSNGRLRARARVTATGRSASKQFTLLAPKRKKRSAR